VKNTLTIINEKDNVGVCLGGNDAIPAGHKQALRDIAEGDFVITYGQIIGRATQNIKAGEWVHTHNVRSHLDEDVAYSYNFCAQTFPATKQTFRGFVRKDRRAGVRNEIYIIPSVGCVNNVCLRLAKAAQEYVSGSLDGIFALTHPFGCSQLGADHENLRRLLASIALNPNATYVLFVGLGCENNRLSDMRAELAPYQRDNIFFFNCQDVEDEIAHGLSILAPLCEKAASLVREELPMSELCIGLKCGGSDGLSGITANPLVGRISDRIVALGGSAILTEVPEMFGAEQRLMDKCADKAVFDRYVDMIESFKRSYTDLGFPVYENPSPGNKEGGITTLEEKSLGCVEKAGKTPIVDVLRYGEPVHRAGVSVLNAPGNDLIAATALAASGAQLVLFTTGRGTPFSTFVPTMKISSNRELAAKKSVWIDFDASGMDEDALMALILRTANGDYRVKSEPSHEIAFYKTGVTL